MDAEALITSAATYATNKLHSMGLISEPMRFLSVYAKVSNGLAYPHINRIFSDQVMIEQSLKESGLEPEANSILLFLTFFRRYLRDNVTPDLKLVTLLKTIKARGLSIGIISDGTTIEQYELLERMGVVDLVDRIVVSEAFGEEKTSVNIFVSIVNSFSLQPYEAIMVGDNLKRDIYWSHIAGLKAVLQTQYLKHSPDLIEPYKPYIHYILKDIGDILAII